jgi:DNA invertase Pin-like site-specific DNA recombinase
VRKLDRLARSVPDARDIADSLVARGVKLAVGSSVYDPTDPMGKMWRWCTDRLMKDLGNNVAVPWF